MKITNKILILIIFNLILLFILYTRLLNTGYLIYTRPSLTSKINTGVINEKTLLNTRVLDKLAMSCTNITNYKRYHRQYFFHRENNNDYVSIIGVDTILFSIKEFFREPIQITRLSEDYIMHTFSIEINLKEMKCMDISEIETE